MSTTTLSPMMAQWASLKAEHKEALLLFRLGDFYEAFFEDAKILSDELDITLTQRQQVPMSGMPYHSAAGHLDTLLSRGFKIAIAEQVETPQQAKGLVRREVVKILTPGASHTTQDQRCFHFIAMICYQKGNYAVAWLDVTLNEAHFSLTQNLNETLNLLTLISPKELLISQQAAETFMNVQQQWPSSILYHEITPCPAHELELLQHDLTTHFHVYSLNALGLTHPLAILACGKLIQLLKNNRLLKLTNITHISEKSPLNYLIMDKATQAHLELFEKREGKHQHLTLFHHLDHTQTHAGSRLFESWLKFPLTQKNEILKRQEGVCFFTSWEKTTRAQGQLKQVKDIQKILTKINLKTVHPQDLKHLQTTLEAISDLVELFSEKTPPLVERTLEQITLHKTLIKEFDEALVQSPTTKLSEGITFKTGYHQELDELFSLTQSQDEFLKTYEQSLKEETGLKTLKVGASRHFGFYIELSKAQAEHAPPFFFRKQTLTNTERFTTQKLELLEKKSAEAKTKLIELEAALFEQLCQKTVLSSTTLIATADALSVLDVLISLSTHGLKQGYSLPKISDHNQLLIHKGRHPIIEDLLTDQQFIPNDLDLNTSKGLFMLITGPNMGGKSTYMRQTALCVIMAQIGSFVPAELMHLSPVDKLFTRIGASDDLTSGQSTFMVEMAETSYILKNATCSSLVILDEIGRGTSTYDGIAIAYGIAQYLLNHPQGLPKTLFATHYFELTELANDDARIFNTHAAVKEEGGELIFCHKILEGAADKSYGIQVAKLAGLPETVLQLARHKLHLLHHQDPKTPAPPMSTPLPEPTQSHPLIQELEELNLDHITPLEALNYLSLWKKKHLT